MKKLIYQGIEEYKKSELNKKLWNRYWKTIALYNQDYTYHQVQTLFGAKSYDQIKTHRKNTNFNSLLNKAVD